MSFEGVDFAFPPETLLEPDELIILARNPISFTERYPAIAVGGDYDRNLSNGGETITIKDEADIIVLSVTYDDEDDWPSSPDGEGYSLELVDPLSDLSDPLNWRPSAAIGGSPGR